MTSDQTSSQAASVQSQPFLDAIEAGDREAFRRLFERYSPGLRRAIAARMDPRIRQRLDPSDILQETELAFFLRIDDYLNRRPMPLEQWLWQTAQQLVVTAWRRHVLAVRRSVAREEPLPDRSSLMLVNQLVKQPPATGLEQQAMALRMETALQQLSRSDREILLLRGVEGLSGQQAAARLGISLTAARKRFTRALLRAREAMNRLAEEDGTQG